MKKIILLVMMGISLILTGCVEMPTDDGSSSEVPTFFYVNDVELSISESTYNLFKNVEVWQGATNVTANATVRIYDNILESYVNLIDCSYSGTYDVTYVYVVNDKEYTAECVIVVGSGDPNKSECNACVGYYDQENLDYKLVWQDEFNGTELDTTKWKYEIGTGTGGWGNNELQYYSSRTDNVSVSDSMLNITLLNDSYGGTGYSSGRITTQYLYSFTYGRVEAYMQVPDLKGTWSAFWMLAEDNSWPTTGEIDIMEHVGYQSERLHGTVHTEANNGMTNAGIGSSKYIGDMTTSFHLYAVEWLPDKIEFSIDGDVYFTYLPTNYSTCPDNSLWPFNDDFFIILNLAYGGDWGGAQGLADTFVTQTMSVDYVRVYQSDIIKELVA